MDNEATIKYNAFTWSYFFAIPYRLSDAGTIWGSKETVQLMNKSFNMQKLTFTSGTGILQTIGIKYILILKIILFKW